MTRHLTAIVEREGDGYVALFPEVDVASQGDTVAEARANLAEALTLFFETASAKELESRTARCHPKETSTVPTLVGRSAIRAGFALPRDADRRSALRCRRP